MRINPSPVLHVWAIASEIWLETVSSGNVCKVCVTHLIDMNEETGKETFGCSWAMSSPVWTRQCAWKGNGLVLSPHEFPILGSRYTLVFSRTEEVESKSTWKLAYSDFPWKSFEIRMNVQ